MGNTKSFARNSIQFADRIRKESAIDGDLMVSFDAVSLFTKVPLSDALQSISTLLCHDKTRETD